MVGGSIRIIRPRWFRLSDYQIFDPDMAVVTFVYGGEGQQGIVLWNLEPGQENDYHLHPTTEHLHIVLRGRPSTPWPARLRWWSQRGRP